MTQYTGLYKVNCSRTRVTQSLPAAELTNLQGQGVSCLVSLLKHPFSLTWVERSSSLLHGEQVDWVLSLVYNALWYCVMGVGYQEDLIWINFDYFMVAHALNKTGTTNLDSLKLCLIKN